MISSSDISIRFLKTDEYQEWNNFIERQADGTLFQSSWWLQTLTGRTPFIVGCWLEGELLGGWPLMPARLPLIRRSMQPPYTPYLAPVLSPRLNREEVLTALLNALAEYSILQVSIPPGYTEDGAASSIPITKKWSRQELVHPTFFMGREEPQTEDKLLQYYSKDARYEVNRARREGLTTAHELDPDALYHLVTLTMEYKDRDVPISIEEVVALHQTLEFRRGYDSLMIGIMDGDGNCIAAAWVVCDPKAGYLLMSGIDRDLDPGYAGALLHHEAIKRVRERGLIFNFEGSRIPGVQHFYQKFNPRRAEVVTYTYLRRFWLKPLNYFLRIFTQKRIF